MRIMLTILGVLTVVLSVHAYESDSHRDMTYHLARASGLNDGMAKMFALANQHIDEGIISSPMLLSVQRQLFHFPGDIEKLEIEGHGVISLPSSMFKAKLALAERNSAIGNYLIYLGLQKGDLVLVGLGLHIKMDTYGHAGFSNIAGHAVDGHNPDRAFLEAPKYRDMIRSMVQSMVSIRQLLPEEAVDLEGALSYLNKFAKTNTFLKRDLTRADMEDATKISGALFEDGELKSIYREDMFRKYEYKRLALEKIYKKFRAEGTINSDIAFEELFPEYIMHDPRLTVKDIIKYVIVTTTDAEFLKSEGGKEIFNLRKLFGIKSDELFLKKHHVEVSRADFRLRQLFFKIERLQNESQQRGFNLDQMNSIIDQFNLEVREQLEQGKKPKHNDIILHMAEKLGVSSSYIREMYHINKEISEEKLELLEGVGASSQFELGSEEYIKMRSHEIAELRMAEEIAIRLTKDMVPAERTSYIKQNFEGDTTNRKFENEYKSTAYRLHRLKHWGVNFYQATDKKSLLAMFKDAFTRFKLFITRKASPELKEEWKSLAAESAAKFLQVSEEMASIDKAEGIGFNKKIKSDAFWRLLRYVGPAFIPFYSFKYIKGLIADAKIFAKNHEVEDVRLAANEGKYAKNPLYSKKSKNVLDFVRKNNRSSVFKCELLFSE